MVDVRKRQTEEILSEVCGLYIIVYVLFAY